MWIGGEAGAFPGCGLEQAFQEHLRAVAWTLWARGGGTGP